MHRTLRETPLTSREVRLITLNLELDGGEHEPSKRWQAAHDLSYDGMVDALHRRVDPWPPYLSQVA